MPMFPSKFHIYSIHPRNYVYQTNSTSHRSTDNLLTRKHKAYKLKDDVLDLLKLEPIAQTHEVIYTPKPPVTILYVL